jgi:acyl-CoA synthetase (AMP-forming)/AMP-acid ligase II
VGPGYYVIAILGCGDGSAACVPVATMPRHYESEAACSAAAPAALTANSDLDFPTLVAQCRGVTRPAAASDTKAAPVPAGAMRG